MLSDVRDVVLIVAGIVWSLVFLVILVVTLVIAMFVHKSLGLTHDCLTPRVPPALGEVQNWVEAVRLQTASLPGSGSERPEDHAGRHVEIRLPFFRRRRRWWRNLLPS
jgi:hypothetical protein